MAISKTAERARELAQPLVEELGLTLWDVVFEKEGATWYLKVLIDKEGGLSMDDCEAFARPFNLILDEEDFIPQAYVFEAGSPGINRKLNRPEHFVQSIGKEVEVRTIRPDPVTKLRDYRGILAQAAEDGSFTLEQEQGRVSFAKGEVSYVQWFSADLY